MEAVALRLNFDAAEANRHLLLCRTRTSTAVFPVPQQLQIRAGEEHCTVCNALLGGVFTAAYNQVDM